MIDVSDVVVRTVNGDVEVSTTGFAEATTVNGSINAVLGAANRSEGLRFTTVNGSVTLEFPEDLDCDLNVQTVNGTTLRGPLDGEVPRACVLSEYR